jgi:hypothetical protein
MEALIALRRRRFRTSRFEDALSQMTMPCLLYAGDADPVFDAVKTAAASVPASSFFSLPGFGHGKVVCPLPRGPIPETPSIPDLSSVALCSPSSSTLRAAPRWPAAMPDFDCAQRLAENWSGQRNGPFTPRDPDGAGHGCAAKQARLGILCPRPFGPCLCATQSRTVALLKIGLAFFSTSSRR